MNYFTDINYEHILESLKNFDDNDSIFKIEYNGNIGIKDYTVKDNAEFNKKEMIRLLDRCDNSKNINLKKVEFGSNTLDIKCGDYLVSIRGDFYIKSFLNVSKKLSNLSELPENAVSIIKLTTDSITDERHNLQILNQKYKTVQIDDVDFKKTYVSSLKKYSLSSVHKYSHQNFIIECSSTKKFENVDELVKIMKTNKTSNVHKMSIKFHKNAYIETNGDIDDLNKILKFTLINSIRNTKYTIDFEQLKNVKDKFDRTKVFKKQITPMTLTKERYYGLIEELNINKSVNDDFNNGKITDKPLMAAYNVTSKTDGVRTHGYIDEKGDLYLFTKSEELPQYTNIKFDKKLKGIIFDGEYVIEDNLKNLINDFVVFDILLYANNDISTKNFYERKDLIDQIIDSKNLTEDKYFKIMKKEFLDINIDNIHDNSKNKLFDTKYDIDGLIFTSNDTLENIQKAKGNNIHKAFKWKNSDFLSIDFKLGSKSKEVSKIIKENDTSIIKKYRVFDLLLKASNNPNLQVYHPISYKDFINGIDSPMKPGELHNFKPFNPTNDNAGKIEIEIEDGKMFCEKSDQGLKSYSKDYSKEIKKDAIIECIYDSETLRWVPIRVRSDKDVPNEYSVSLDIWQSLNVTNHDPITYENITNKNSIIKEIDENQKIYYSVKEEYGKQLTKQRDADKNIRAFHRLKVKKKLFAGVKDKLKNKKLRLLDIGSGKGGDSKNYLEYFDSVVGIDLSYDNIENGKDGAYVRLNNILHKDGINEKRIREKITFLVGNGTENFADPKTFKGEYKDIAKNKNQGIFSNEQTFDCISVMFSIHYMFENQKTFDTFLSNITNNLKPGGLLIGCCYDSKKILEYLGTNKKYEINNKDDDDIILRITTKKKHNFDDKIYLGKQIDVLVNSIGNTIPEYLVNFDFMKEKLESIGLEEVSTDNFKTFYEGEQFQSHENTNTHILTQKEQDFSFLNRSFIFQRQK
jgi:hypothetical protein